ncbi:hypothetical protein RND81_03G147800 [Saponaria officinalis]|uniref:Lachrymatory factor synthase n=1 Tax=Saponaria officinalis TaxID=3572 RepID=A0AAW1M840_SAPOF
MEEQKSKEWKGETSVELQNTTPKQIWPLISNFCTINKWLPHVKTCYLLQGVHGEPGMIRYCGSTELLGEGTQWATEKLLTIDSSNMCFSYEIVDNNVGFKRYVATVRLEEVDGGEGVCGCRIVWSFVADPVEGFSFEGFVGFIESIAKVMGTKMQEALLNNEVGLPDSLNPSDSGII